MRLISLILFILTWSPLFSQTLPPTGSLESPYQAVYQHLYYLQSEHLDPGRASAALTSAGDSATMSRLAIQLKQILDGSGLSGTKAASIACAACVAGGLSAVSSRSMF